MMNNLLLTVYPVLYFVFVFYGAGRSKKGEIAAEYLCLQQAKMIQASACVGIILHHVTQRVTTYGQLWRGPVTVFNYLGFLFTALFFFLSGYGLLNSIQSKPGYLRTFLRKRLSTVLIPFWVINLCVILFRRVVYGVRGSAAGILKDFFGIRLLNSNGWFVIEIVILYLLFFLLFSLIRNRDAALALLCIAVLLLIRFGFSRGHDPMYGNVSWFRGEWWYNSTITFVFGLLYARFRKKADEFCRKHYIMMLSVTAVVFLVLFCASWYAVDYLGYYHEHLPSGRRDAAITLAWQSAACIVFATLVMLLNMKITIGSRALRFVSKISLPLLLVHRYILDMDLPGVRISDFRRYALVLSAGMICAAAITPVINRIISIVNPKQPVSPAWVHDTLEAQNAALKREKRLHLLRIGAVVCAVPALIAAGFMTFGRSFLAEREYREECESIRLAKIGDRVYWGRFDTDPVFPGKERLTWLVIKREGSQVCLLSEKGIAGSCYNQKHDAVTWMDSDLRGRLDSQLFTEIFSAAEEKSIILRNGDRISLLTPEEAMEVFQTDRERELAITDSAELNGTNINRPSKVNQWDMKGYRSSWWWLKGENSVKEITAPIVSADGAVLMAEKAVNKPGGAIRPVIWVGLD